MVIYGPYSYSLICFHSRPRCSPLTVSTAIVFFDAVADIVLYGIMWIFILLRTLTSILDFHFCTCLFSSHDNQRTFSIWRDHRVTSPSLPSRPHTSGRNVTAWGYNTKTRTVPLGCCLCCPAILHRDTPCHGRVLWYLLVLYNAVRPRGYNRQIVNNLRILVQVLWLGLCGVENGLMVRGIWGRHTWRGGEGWREQRAFQGQRWELEFKIQDATVYIKNDSF